MKFSLNYLIVILIATLPIISSAKTKSTSKDVVDLSLIDQTKNPCDDFFQYACGNWLNNTPIPADKSDLYRFSEIDENTLLILKNLLENYQAGTNTPPQIDHQKLGDAYSACMNIPGNEVSAKNETEKLIAKINQLKIKQDLLPLLASLQSKGISPFFAIYSMQNPGDATHMIATLDQSGMGLPEKDYYFSKDNLKTRNLYLIHIQKSLILAGLSTKEATNLSKKIFKLETAIAQISLSSLEQQDPQKTYNPIGKSALQKITPQLDWNKYFGSIGMPKSDSLNIVSPNYFKSLSFLLTKTPIEDIKSYLIWQTIYSTSYFSTLALQVEHFNFFGKILNGKKERQPHWKACVSTVDSSLGEALGESFIKIAFGEESKNVADVLVANIKSSLKEIVTNLDWMDNDTKKGALKKVMALNQKIGYPKSFKSYENLPITKDSWFLNTLASNLFSFKENLNKANLPVNRNEWGMTPPTNNAYYDPTMNEIVFPAGILQAPLFNITSSLAANYGATGATIGHEITHGFDDSGSQYDENGNLANWWTAKSSQIYSAKAQCLVKQYSNYTSSDGLHLNGELSIGENIADLGGLKIALAAYNKEVPNAPNSDLKTFFIAYAQSWCGKLTSEAEHTQINSDVHSLPKFRVNGVVSNLPEFSNAFQCTDGQAMAPTNRCTIW